MWSGSEIVRVAGQPATTQYILDRKVKPAVVMTLSDAVGRGIYSHNPSQADPEDSNAAPNLTLNVQDASALRWELLTAVVIGILIQIMTFVLGGFIVYGWLWRAGSNMISAYGFPCYLVGTVLLTFGLLGCARVIQNTSRIDELSPKDPDDELSPTYEPFCVQKGCTVDDKKFLSYAIFHPEGQSTIKVSRSTGRDYNLVTLCSIVVALVGYVCQFIGLRAMHWSVALIQLAATLTVTCARAFIRRGLANQPIYQPLPMGTDAAGLAYLLCQAESWELVTGTSVSNEPTRATLSNAEDIDPDVNMPSLLHELQEMAADPNPSNDLIMTAKSIGQTVATEHSTSLLAQQLINAIRAIMTICSRRQEYGDFDVSFNCNEHLWALQPSLIMQERPNEHLPAKTILHVFSRREQMEIPKADYGNTALTADPGTISAILSLWLAVLARPNPPKRVQALDENETARRPQYYRIISNDCVPDGKDISKWLSSQTTLHMTTVTQLGRLPKDRQAKSAPVFGIYFSSHNMRLRALAK